MATIITNKNFPAQIGGDDTPIYKVSVFEADSPNGLEDEINTSLEEMKNHPAESVALLDIGYSSARSAGNMISYSAAVTYVYFGMPA